jgi:hypothetical protein
MVLVHDAAFLLRSWPFAGLAFCGPGIAAATPDGFPRLAFKTNGAHFPLSDARAHS